MQLLDLYCGAGGAAEGYHRAGFTKIVGVDIEDQPRYPYTFVRGDALAYLAEYGHLFAGIHASPPCQKFVNLHKMRKDRTHIDHLTPTIRALKDQRRPYVIENVMSAPMPTTLRLCGSTFNLRVRRHRRFFTSFIIPQPACQHARQESEGPIVGVYGNRGKSLKGPTGKDIHGGKRYRTKAQASAAMSGLDWMITREIVQAVPPVYTHYTGIYLMAHLTGNYPTIEEALHQIIGDKP